MHPPALRSLLAAALSILGLAPAAAIRADEIVVKGEPMSGTVEAVTADGIEVETSYGKGNVLVKYEDITALRTDKPFVVIHGEEARQTGRLLGVRDGDKLLVGADEASAAAVPVGGLFPSYTEEKFNESALLRARALLRYWKARYDLTFGFDDSTVNSTSVLTGFEVERKKSPTRLLLTGSFRYGTEDDPDGLDSEESVTDNELLGTIRGEYDMTSRVYSYLAAAAEHDAVDKLSLRAVPRGGIGVHIIKEKKYWWDADVGPAWVYENFFGDEDHAYAAVAFGTEFFLTLPFGMTLTSRGEYLPNVEDWADDYMLRGKTTLAYPMTDWISLTTSLIDTYDSMPAEDTSQNSLTLTGGLALTF